MNGQAASAVKGSIGFSVPFGLNAPAMMCEAEVAADATALGAPGTKGALGLGGALGPVELLLAGVVVGEAASPIQPGALASAGVGLGNFGAGVEVETLRCEPGPCATVNPGLSWSPHEAWELGLSLPMEASITEPNPAVLVELGWSRTAR